MLLTLTKLLPMSVPISGRRHDLLLSIADSLLPRPTSIIRIETPAGVIDVDPKHKPERFLGYYYHNLLRYYENSDLGKYIENLSKNSGDWFVDAGANLGVYSLIARRYGFKTLAIEPEPKHSAFLCRNEHIFGKIECAAVSDADGSLPLFMEKGNPGSTSLFEVDSYEKSEFEVPVRKLSDVIKQHCEHNLHGVKLIKIDVEGFEANAVRGLQDFLEAGFRPDIWCEVRGSKSGRNGGSFRHVSDVLQRFAYSRTEFVGGRYLNPTDADCDARGVFDLLFRPG